MKIMNLVKPLVALAMLASLSTANAGLISLHGDFSATAPTPVPIGLHPTFSGSWSANFDDSVLVPGLDQVLSLSLDTFDLDPNPFGGTIFDTTNTGVTLVYLAGDLFQISLGGLDSGTRGISRAPDFWVSYILTVNSIANVRWRQSDNPSLGGNVSFGDPLLRGSFSITSISNPAAVPETGSLALLSLGLISLRRRISGCVSLRT